jgi:hypothetical protein
MRPALACLKIVILETANISASSFAVRARPILSIRSASDNGSVELFLELHDSIYLLKWIYVRGNCRNCLSSVLRTSGAAMQPRLHNRLQWHSQSQRVLLLDWARTASQCPIVRPVKSISFDITPPFGTLPENALKPDI